MADRAEMRKIHIRLLPDLHRRLRIRCAELDTTIQDFVVELLERELGQAERGAKGEAEAGHEECSDGGRDER